MAKINTSTIEGYESMTAEQKLAALEALDMPDYDQLKSDYDKLKVASDRNASEAADYKKKYNSTLSAAEQQKQADEEARKATETRLAELERKEKIANAKDEYVASGWDVALAKETAEAFVDGKMDVVLANINKHATAVANAAKDKALKDTPAPPAGGNPNQGAIDYDKKIAEAMEAGDRVAAAKYSRLKSTQSKNK